MLPSLYSPKNPTVESTVGGGGGGLPGAGMRLEVVRAVDGLADGRRTEEAIRCAVGPAESRETPVADGWGGRARRWLVKRPGDRRAVARADTGADAHRDGRLRPACGRVGRRPPGKHSRPPGGRLCRRVGGRPADGDADGRAHFHRSERPSPTPRH